MSAFEDFVNLELPRRRPLLTVAITGYDGDPNDGGAPDILKNAPVGSWYLQETPVTIYEKLTAGTATWTIPGAVSDHPGSGANSVQVGSGASAAGDRSTSVGVDSEADFNDAVAVGYFARAFGSGVTGQSVAVGSSSFASLRGTAVGYSASAQSSDSVAVGTGAFATSNETVALGSGAFALALRSCALGNAVLVGAAATDGIGIGGGSVSVTHAGAIVIGRSAVSTAVNRCTIGTIGGSYDRELQIGLGLGVWGVAPPASQPSKINDPTGQANDLDSEARTAINAIIDVIEGAGLAALV
jgi:hypothetical protein